MDEIVYYYPVGGCPFCADMFKDFFIFCVQNNVDYNFKKDTIVKLPKSAIKWRNKWFLGDEALDKFKEEWKTRKDDYAVQ